MCNHLLGEAAGLGFNRDEPTAENSFPDAWCDDCEIIYAAHGGWNDESQKLAKISLLCARCYERTRIRNTRTSVTLEDLANLRWKCGSCEDWHVGPCLDFGYDSPHYWRKEYETESRRDGLLPSWRKGRSSTFPSEDYCAINEDFFVRGLIHLPIIGTSESFCWGVWGSLSRQNFEILMEKDKDPNRVELPAMFSWLSTQILEYPDTLNLKMHAYIQKLGLRPTFELEPSDHPLSQEFQNGITAERVKELMTGRVRGTQ